jgi:hypothetical protein
MRRLREAAALLVTRPTTVSALTRLLDRLPHARHHTPCLPEAPSPIIVFFRHPSTDDVPVALRRANCTTLDNRHLTRIAAGRLGRRLLRRLTPFT